MRRSGVRDRLLVVVGLALIVVAVMLWVWWYPVSGQIYAHRSTGQDRDAAQLIGRLIEEAISGSEGTAPEAC